MKANELMIGDWIQYENKYVMVVGFETHSKLISFLFGDEEFSPKALIEGTEYLIQAANDTDFYCLPEADIVPIPITPEILKKNWFDFLYSSVPGGTPQEQRMRKVDTYKWQGLVVNYYHETNDFQMVNFRGVRLDYVHQFQHALRLTGIDKEIVL